MADGTTIHQWKFNGNNSQKWIFEHQGDGYYTVKSANSNDDYYLGVKDDANAHNHAIVLRTGTITDGMKWFVSVTTSGAYRLTPKTGDWCLATDTSDQTNGIRLIQGEYKPNNGSYRDEWYLEPYRRFDVSLIALQETYDRSSYFGDIVTDLQSIGYTSYFNNHSIVSNQWTKSQVLEFMKHSKITLIRTHGNETAIQTSDGTISNYDFFGLPSNTLHYSELIIYGACLTASDGEFADNLVSATVDAGARTVIGFQDKVHFLACNEWCKVFFEYFVSYYDDDTKNYYDVCNKTDEKLQGNEYYHSETPEGIVYSVKNFVIAGQKTLPGN